MEAIEIKRGWRCHDAACLNQMALSRISKEAKRVTKRVSGGIGLELECEGEKTNVDRQMVFVRLPNDRLCWCDVVTGQLYDADSLLCLSGPLFLIDKERA